MNLLAGLNPAEREQAHRATPPARAEPMLATLTHEPFSDDAWIFERKLDGERVVGLRTGGRVRLRSRYAQACEKGWEGLIAKRADSLYRPGRSRDWLKFKCVARQELVIGGWTDPRGSRAGLGALLVGYYDGRDLVYAGKVGTGFGEPTLRDLYQRLSRRERNAPPFATSGDLPRLAHWAEPDLVCETAFTEWTREGRLRHPRYLGLRDDKDPREVTKERPS